MSPGQTGRTPWGVPPKFFMFIGFFLSPLTCFRPTRDIFRIFPPIFGFGSEEFFEEICSALWPNDLPRP